MNKFIFTLSILNSFILFFTVCFSIYSFKNIERKLEIEIDYTQRGHKRNSDCIDEIYGIFGKLNIELNPEVKYIEHSSRLSSR